MNIGSFGRQARTASHEDARLAAEAAAGGAGRPILDYINQELPPEAYRETAIARKHNCRGVWCPVCYRRLYLAKHYARLRGIPWEEARMLTLTLDRDKVGIGADAYVWLREKKALGRFFVSLERLGVEIRDWCGQIEFHRDGTPHFHILVRTEAGPSGMIGNAALLSAWPWGLVHEEYFKNEKHYENVVGYFGKAGYFHKKKQHQTVLPDYFKSEYFKGKRIQRFYSARGVNQESLDIKEVSKTASPGRPLESVPGRRLEECGQSTIIFYMKEDEGGFPAGEKFFGRLPIAYGKFLVTCPGYYEKGLGYVFFLDGDPSHVDAPPF